MTCDHAEPGPEQRRGWRRHAFAGRVLPWSVLEQWGDEVEKEKDFCLERFAEFGAAVCAELRAAGHWADYIDPCSGLPMLTKGCNKVYDEVTGMQLLLRFASQNAGCCKILLHPTWGSAVYPATLFTTAPFEQLRETLARYPDARTVSG